jgi:hypothetical protein
LKSRISNIKVNPDSGVVGVSVQGSRRIGIIFTDSQGQSPFLDTRQKAQLLESHGPNFKSSGESRSQDVNDARGRLIL